MRRLRRKILLSILATVAMLLLSGCTLGSSVEELFTLPQLSAEEQGLSDSLAALLSEGYEYMTPDNGSHVEAVQMVDIDGDDVQEAVVFLRRSKDPEALEIRVFRKGSLGYECLCTIENRAERVESISYRDLTGDGRRELIVDWRVDEDNHNLAVYQTGVECVMLMHCDCDRYMAIDLAGDGITGLLVLNGEAGQPVCMAQYFCWETDLICPTADVIIHSDVEKLSDGSLVSGHVAADLPAAFITGVDQENDAITDVVFFDTDGDVLTTKTVRYAACGLAPQDIDEDGITEIPEIAEGEETRYGADALVYWYQVASDGAQTQVCTTYHCQKQGWYLRLPEEYSDRLTGSNWDPANDENCTMVTIGEDNVAAVYTLTGENRESRAAINDRVLLLRLPSTIYVGEVYDTAAQYGLNEKWLRENFHLIVSNWDNGEKE